MSCAVCERVRKVIAELRECADAREVELKKQSGFYLQYEDCGVTIARNRSVRSICDAIERALDGGK